MSKEVVSILLMIFMSIMLIINFNLIKQNRELIKQKTMMRYTSLDAKNDFYIVNKRLSILESK